MTRGFNFQKPLPIPGRGFLWLPFNGENLITPDRFTLEQWHRIVYDIDDNEQWKAFLKRYRDFLACYVLYPDGATEPIAMCYLLAEHALYDGYMPGSVVSVHGGGWNNDTRSKLLYAKSWITLIHNLASIGCKVLTNVKDDNTSAKHLVTKTGFRLNELDLYEYHPDKDPFLNHQ